jgi:endonuclease/exonuclease/phosphatase family metal-dependent hydrolase
MKLVQLNAWGGRLEYKILDFFKKINADIICLQEAIDFKGESGLFASIVQIQDKAQTKYSAIAPVFSYNYMDSVAEFGNCILSKFPVLKSETIFTNLEHTKNFSFDKHKTAAMRNFLHTSIQTPQGNIEVVTHHGHHVAEHKNGNEETTRQIKQIADYVSTLSAPLVLTGDFNLAPHSQSLTALNDKLNNLSMSHRLNTTRTPLTHKTEVCDYVFVNDKIKINKFYASDEVVSDHSALIIDFEI